MPCVHIVDLSVLIAVNVHDVVKIELGSGRPQLIAHIHSVRAQYRITSARAAAQAVEHGLG